MKNPEDILRESIEALAGTSVPPGPPPELIDATTEKLKELNCLQGEPETIRIVDRLTPAKGLLKFAAAAAILIAAGYAVGRFSAPKMPDVQQLQAALEPAIRQKLSQEMMQYWQGSLAGSFTQLKDEIQQQYRRDLSDFAIQTLAASSTVTNQRLLQLIDAINASQTHERQWYATALETLALQTEDQLQKTRQDMVQLLSYPQPNNIVPNESRNPNNTIERRKK